jgi:hypothetical protein
MMRGYNGDFNEFMGVWRSGSGAQRWWTNTGSSFDQFKVEDQANLAAGLRLVAFPPYGLNAIWHPGDGVQWVKFAVELDAFKQADTEFFQQGLRLVDMSTGASP